LASTNREQMGQHVAMKCTYNNGGEGVLVGFNGTCSEDIIKWNVDNGRIWCSNKDCECKKYYDTGFKGNAPVDPCYESCLFRDWEFGAGWYHTGSKAGRPMTLAKVRRGKLAVLTTRFPGDDEEDRKIIGFFKIAEVRNAPGKETYLVGDRRFGVRLPIEEATELLFWDYYSTKGGSLWGTGLFRYLDDSQVMPILADLRDTIRDTKARQMIDQLLREDFANTPIPPPLGPRAVKSGSRNRRIAIARKYGHGGEGEEHKNLKQWVATHPESIGLTNVTRPHIEYVFPSGDAADIVFELPSHRYAVVEVETWNPLPGCYQALKYKVLKCAEIGLEIDSPNIEAIVVARISSREIKDFCSKYGLRFVQKEAS